MLHSNCDEQGFTSLNIKLITLFKTHIMNHRNQIQWIVEFSIEEGKYDQFRELIEKMIRIVESTEPGTKSYTWYIDEEKKTRCIVSEWYENSEAALAHLNGEGMKTILIPKILTVATITRLEAYGNPSQELREAISKFGSKNYLYLSGFTR
jgi:quinol monooxygenase YgiN